MSETQLSHAIREALLATGKVVLWRNNTGKLQDKTGRWVTFGLGVGCADLVGFIKGTGQFVAFEVKTDKGKETVEQHCWRTMVNKFGGLSFVVRSVEEALAALP